MHLERMREGKSSTNVPNRKRVKQEMCQLYRAKCPKGKSIFGGTNLCAWQTWGQNTSIFVFSRI